MRKIKHTQTTSTDVSAGGGTAAAIAIDTKLVNFKDRKL
jgi:hypothetical protein